MTAFNEMCPDRLDLLHPYYRHICRLLVDADEWGQSVVLDVLMRYARAMLEKPDLTTPAKLASAEESDDDFAGVDIDLAMLLDCAKPLFQSRNPGVVLATAKTFYHLAPPGHAVIGQELLVAPLLRLAGSSRAAVVGGEEVAALTWDVIASMADERPVGPTRLPLRNAHTGLKWLFASHHSSFLLHASDSAAVKLMKLRAMRALISEDTAQVSMREFKVGPPEKLAS